MTKSRKMPQHNKPNNMTVRYNCCDATYKCIHKWYTAMFEKLGWMILAKNHGFHEKVVNYKHSLERLKDTIEKKWKHIRDKDKKDDLAIMLDNVNCLIAHAEKDL